MDLSSAERRRRECGWRVSVPVEQQRIPSYDDFQDRNTFDQSFGQNLISRGNQYTGESFRNNTRGKRRNSNNNNRGGSRGRRGNKSRGSGGGNDKNRKGGKSSSVSQTIFKELRRKHMVSGKQEIMQSPPRSLSGMTSSNPGPLFDFAPAHFRVNSIAQDKETKHAELEVLKLILIREGYVRRLGDVARQIMDGDRTILRAAGGTFIVDLLVQTRASSLAVVRAVVAWRDTLTRKLIERLCGTTKSVSQLNQKQQNDIALARCEPFVWNGINYLLKMCHDTDFLAGTQPLVHVSIHLFILFVSSFSYCYAHHALIQIQIQNIPFFNQALGVREENMIHNPLMMPDGLEGCPRPSKQERIKMEESIGLPPPSTPNEEKNDENKGNTAPETGKDKKDAATTTEEQVLKLAWVLLAEERQARRVLRREAKFQKWEEEEEDHRGRNDRDDYDDRQYDDGDENDPQGDEEEKMEGKMEVSNGKKGGLNPALANSPLRSGNERLNSRPFRGSRVDDSRGGGSRGGGSRGGSRKTLNDLRPVLAWHEKARLLMERWEREMAVSAWPSDASTGRMTAPKRSRRKLGPLPSRGGSRGSSTGGTPMLNTPMWGGERGRSRQNNNRIPVPNFPHGGNARSLPQLGRGPQRAYGRPLTKKSKHRMRASKNKPVTLNGNDEEETSNDPALSRSNLVTLASMVRPPPAVVLVSATVMILLSPGETVPEDLMWSSLRREIADTDVFLKRIATFKSSGAKDIPRFKIRALQPFLCNPSFVPGPLRSVSAAAAALCAWALQIVRSRPQYMEWLGAVGAAALRAKTPSSPRDRGARSQQNDEDDSYGSDDSYGNDFEDRRRRRRGSNDSDNSDQIYSDNSDSYGSDSDRSPGNRYDSDSFSDGSSGQD
jgi:hypothetical protein